MKILWIIGSMASGKTTQHKLLMKLLGNGKITTKNGTKQDPPYCYSISGSVGSLGLLKEGVQTCGIDPVYGDLKKEGLRTSMAMAFEDGADLIIMEGAQASMEWYKQVILPQYYDAVLYVVHLSISFDHNLQRLRQRRWLKTHDNLDEFTGSNQMFLEDRTYENVLGKNKQYRSLFKALSKESEREPLSIRVLEIDALEGELEIVEKILEFIYNNEKDTTF